MKIVLCYIAVAQGPLTEEYAARFAATYHEYPPGAEHDTLIISNGGVLKTGLAILFSGMKPKMLPRNNDGWDLGGYLEAARGPGSDYDAMLCCGETIYFHRAGWLKRFVDAWEKYGPGMYGAFSSNLVRSHLNTTGFLCAPDLLTRYRSPVLTRSERYQFEHGERALWRQLVARKTPVRLVTWDGDWEPTEWRKPPDILWRGNQSNCLMWCSHTDRYVKADPVTQSRWGKAADRPFK